ncbi:MAG: GrpB family protein [Pricia sp.]
MLIQKYTPDWPQNYQALKLELGKALGGIKYQIEHVGSTSVPQLAAKPIIDIDITHQTETDFQSIKSRLIKIRYYHNGNQGILEREVFKRGRKYRNAVLDTIAHHFYVCPAGSKALERHLLFREIVQCPYSEELKDLFLLSKSIELLVLQAESYSKQHVHKYIKSKKDKTRLIAPKELLTSLRDHPPTLSELSKLVSLNEYKLKRGFKELFGTTVFGYIHQSRMDLAKRLLLGTSKTGSEIAYETGYGSPQHFSKAFKRQFGIPPNSIRKAPDATITKKDDPSNLNR